MKVSIIIPVYNVEEYLKECLESAVNQTLDNIEIICINDGSTDSSIEILNSYTEKYKNIKVVNQENKGLSASRNVGINKSKGKYIYFLDSDDYIDLECIEKCYYECEKYQLDIITFDAECFYDNNYNGNVIFEDYDRSDYLDNNILTGRDFYIKANKNNSYRAPVWLNFYRKQFIEENELFFIEDILHEDEVYTCESMLLAKRVKYINNKFFKRRYRNDSIMTSSISLKRIESNMIIAETINNLRINHYKEDSVVSNILKIHIIRFLTNVIIYCDRLNLYNERKLFSDKIKNMKIDIDIDLDLKINSPLMYYFPNHNNMQNENSNLFLIHTPYHMILATGIAQNENNKWYINDIIIRKKFNITEYELEKLKTVFNNIYILEDSTYIEEVNNMLEDKKYNSIFVNNDTELSIQYILNSRLTKNGEIVYIEDGIGCYEPFDNNVKIGIGDKDAEYYSKLLNMKIENINTFGTYSKINKRYFLYPNLVTERLNDGKEHIDIDEYSIKSAIDLLYGDYYYKLDIKFDKIILIALEHSEYFNLSDGYSLETYIELINKIIHNLKEVNVGIYLKYHPREINNYLDNIVSIEDNIFIVNKNIPIEALYKVENLYLISMKSTALITYCKILTPKNVICIDRMLSNKEEHSKSIFSRLNIHMPNSIEQIINHIK